MTQPSVAPRNGQSPGERSPGERSPGERSPGEQSLELYRTTPDTPLPPVRLATQALDIYQLGDTLARCGYFQDASQAGQAVVKVLAGSELGFGPIASMTGIHVIKGRVTLSSGLIGAAIKRSGKYDYRVIRIDDKVCTLHFFESGKQIGESTFSEQDAKRADTKNMGKFPRNMLMARALTNGARWFCPDVFSGPIYTPDELGAEIDEVTGEVLHIETAQPSKPAPTPTPRNEPEPAAEEPGEEEPDYDAMRAKATAWLKSRPPEDFEDAVLEVRGRISEWPKDKKRWCELDIEGVEEWATAQRAHLRRMRLAARKGVEAGNIEEVQATWKSKLKDLPGAWQAHAEQLWAEAIIEAEAEMMDPSASVAEAAEGVA